LTDTALRLYPLPAREISSSAIYRDIDLPPPKRRDPSRPYVILNSVASVDGRTTIEGKASCIGSEVDRTAMRTLRSKVDAVMIGANTLRAEKLSLGLDEPGDDTTRQPLAVIVSKTGEVPLQSNLIVAEGQQVLVITTQNAPEDLDDRLRESARVLRAPSTRSGDVKLGTVLKILKAEHAVDLLLVEGGPILNHALISSDLTDELFLTLAPKLLGGTPDETLGFLNGPARVARDINLLSIHLASDEMFLRYSLHPLKYPANHLESTT
jgi:2,5-diamino-6-(ribosylamino)-4(3H)-pyrimidinone 5'-phosphate reductase